MTSVTIAAGETRLPTRLEKPPRCGTYAPRLEMIRSHLSQKPLQPPNRTRPLRHLSQDELKRIAAANPPPASWFEGNEEYPF